MTCVVFSMMTEGVYVDSLGGRCLSHGVSS